MGGRRRRTTDLDEVEAHGEESKSHQYQAEVVDHHVRIVEDYVSQPYCTESPYLQTLSKGFT